MCQPFQTLASQALDLVQSLGRRFPYQHERLFLLMLPSEERTCYNKEEEVVFQRQELKLYFFSIAVY